MSIPTIIIIIINSNNNNNHNNNNNNNNIGIPLFTLGSIYSTCASGAEQGTRIPTGRRQTSWLFTSVVEDLNSGLP